MDNINYDGPERRADHDLIIGMAHDLKHLCKKQESYRAETKEDLKEIGVRIDEQTKSCTGRVTECNKFFVSGRVFYTSLLLVVSALGVLGTVAYEAKTETIRHRSVVRVITKDVHDRLDKLDNMYGFGLTSHENDSRKSNYHHNDDDDDDDGNE